MNRITKGGGLSSEGPGAGRQATEENRQRSACRPNLTFRSQGDESSIAELAQHNAEFDWWESLTDKERDAQIRWRMEHG